MRCLSLSGLCWAKKTGIFILGTLTIMTVAKRTFFKALTLEDTFYSVRSRVKQFSVFSYEETPERN